ncbi:MAG: lectin like domain-containing protein, partial [Agathobacter sp.]
NSVRFSLHEDSAVVGDKKVSIESALTEQDGTLFVSLNDLSELLGYSLNFDIVNKTVTTADTSESATIIPPRYDLREKQRVSKIRNQGSYGTCWAFAATSALESMMLPENPEYFAVDHMTLCNSFKVDQFDGGEYTMGMAYLAAWQGPVYEADDPDGDGKSDSSLTAVKHVQEMRIIDGKDYEAIKTAVFKYGGVQTTLYSNIRSSNPDSEYYNSETSAYCYIGTEKPNHGVVIIGWDDNYSKDNFNTDLEGDGAFICQNSWGEKFGEDGVFYVSYYDTNIGTHNVVYTRVEDTDNYDVIYQSDLCGWVGSIGYEKESIFGANVYTANGEEEIAAAGFYATGAKTEYEVFVVNNFEDENSLVHRTSVASGTLDQAGYYTIDFDTPVTVENGERFAIVVYLNTPGALHPFALEYDDGEDALSLVDTSDGESYISASGMRFVNVKELQDCNLCIKAYSNKR